MTNETAERKRASRMSKDDLNEKLVALDEKIALHNRLVKIEQDSEKFRTVQMAMHRRLKELELKELEKRCGNV